MYVYCIKKYYIHVCGMVRRYISIYYTYMHRYIYIILMLYTYIKTHVQDAWQLKCVPSRRSLAPDLNVEEQKNLSDRQVEIG